MPRHENEFISGHTLKQVIFHRYTNTQSIPISSLKKQFWSPTQQPNQFNPYTEIKSSSSPTLKWLQFDPHSQNNSFSMPPDKKNKLISIQTLNNVSFHSHPRTSQFRSMHWNQGSSDPPNWNEVYFDHPHNKQVNLSTLKPCDFRPVFLAWYTPGTCSCDIRSSHRYHINTSTNLS